MISQFSRRGRGDKLDREERELRKKKQNGWKGKGKEKWADGIRKERKKERKRIVEEGVEFWEKKRLLSKDVNEKRRDDDEGYDKLLIS